MTPLKHIMITGGAGFIGSHLCDAFLKQGYAVTAVDNLVTGQMSNLRDALQSPNFHFVNHDVSEPFDATQFPFLSQHGLAGVLHFACPASPVDFEKIPFEILHVDSFGTAHTVELASKYQSRYVLASTSEIYGDPLVHPQQEEYWGNVNTIGPRACYDETKRFAEAYVSSAIRYKDLNAGMVRIFNTYGPRMRLDDGRVVPELCAQALQGNPLTIHGSGQQTRSFCYVSDLVDGIIRYFKSDIREPINLGNPVERSILEFAETVQSITGTQLLITHLPGREDDPKKRCPDITRAKERLGWTPEINLQTGLKLTIEYFQSLL